MSIAVRISPCIFLGILACAAPAAAQSRVPNVVLVLCDNLGYGDVGCFGSTKHRTPHIDQLARDGMRLTSCYSASGVCTPSRAALMTGCYPRRVGLDFPDPDGAVLRPVSPNGLHPKEETIAEMLRVVGYRSTCIGKWHLGDQPPFLPTRQGFDSFFGIPYSDDMTAREGKNWPPLPLMLNEKVVEAPADRNLLTRRYTEAAVKFIHHHKQDAFFVYLPQAMPGSTRRPFASSTFQGRSKNGPYGDCVEELDWSVGEIRKAIADCHLERDTLFIWTSDNGAPRRDPPQGSNLPLGGWGYTTREGGMRVPCIVAQPGFVPAGSVCDELCTLMDWLPTLAALCGGKSEGAVDGRDITPLLRGVEEAETPHQAFYYYHRNQLQAVRNSRWKLTIAQGDTPAQLFDLKQDPAEKQDLAAMHPEAVKELTQLADRAISDLGSGDKPGNYLRPVGRIDNPTARVKAAKKP